ncbi:response regulator [Sphaerochaeta sp.]|uniref:response regulator n=1 Tax=Sphaerochaeta sp. TaxID=1972642 RepID=UPI002587E098|nr:response regulator [Sphaerochaeta sp.]MDD3457052.1 response regulator [Sphaerochaeta sp.]MDD4038962.1 response regulator [Sphaerochaeta sp.]
MYKVFIAEDEIVVREGLRNSIQAGSGPFVLVGEASDGEMALSIMKDVKPDILITDIRMPFVDGLSLSRIIKKILPWIKIIIISGHDEFQYAQEAISIGVDEYILKPISASDMLLTLGKLVDRIEQEKLHLSSIENLKQQAQSNSDLIRERWLYDLVTGIVKTEDALEKGGDMGLDLIAHGYLVAIINLSISSENYAELINAKLNINSLIDHQEEVLCFSQSRDSIVLLLKQLVSEPLEETAYTLGQAIKYEVERNTKCLVTIGIGSFVERIGSLSQSYADAEKAITFSVKTGQNLIIGIHDLNTFSEIDFLKLDGSPISERLKYVKKSGINEIIAQYMTMIGTDPLQTTLISYYLLYDLMVAISRIIDELGGVVQEVIPCLSNKAQLLEMAGSKETFCDGVKSILDPFIDFRDQKAAGKYYEMIQKAKQHINLHFADQDISLHSVASIVHVSPNHFSTIFSQETGETFIEYLTRVRINTSKELLLTTSHRSADIAYEVGFGDPHYFSYIFKKHTGISPREFRTGSKCQS